MSEVYWLNAGVIDVNALHTMQNELIAKLSQRQPGEIRSAVIACELEPTITFGINPKTNRFSDELENQYSQLFAQQGKSFRTETGALSPDAISYLQNNSVESITFKQSKRGGGAAYFAPGQQLYILPFCIDDLNTKGLHARDFFANGADQTLQQSLQYFANQAQPPIVLENDFEHPESGKDIFYTHGTLPTKIGSKGYRIGKVNGLNFGQYGLSLFVSPQGISHFDRIYPCGHCPKTLNIDSLENMLGRKIAKSELHSVTQDKLKDAYAISTFTPVDYKSL